MRSTFAHIVGDEWVKAPEAPFDEWEGFRPKLVVAPGTAEHVAEVLRAASENGLAVIPLGSGHLQGLGNPPRAADVLVSTERLTRISEYEPADLTATVQAGTTLGRLNERLVEHRQVLPWDPPGGADRTLGGIAAVGGAGTLRLGFGQPRDWILGVEVATGDGRLIRAGGRVVKNVAGYDLTKLFVGSLGTLGIITEMNVRVRPQPATELTVIVSSGDSAPLWQLARAIGRSIAQPIALEIASADAVRWAGLDVVGSRDYLCARFAGEEADVRDEVLLVESLAAETGVEASEKIGTGNVAPFWRGLADLPIRQDLPIVLRISVPPSRLEDMNERARRSLSLLAEETAYCAAPGLGTLRVFLGGATGGERTAALAPEIEALRTVCRADSGSLVVERAPLELKRRLDVWGEVGGAESLMRGMKRLFDPHGRLNPGRFVAGM